MKSRYEPGDEVGIGGGTRTVHAVVVSDNGETVTVDNSIDDIAPPGGQVFTVARHQVHPSAEEAVLYTGRRAQGVGAQGPAGNPGPGIGTAVAVGLGAVTVVGLAAYWLGGRQTIKPDQFREAFTAGVMFGYANGYHDAGGGYLPDDSPKRLGMQEDAEQSAARWLKHFT